MSTPILKEAGERNKPRDGFRIRGISTRETVAMFDMTGYVALKRLLTEAGSAIFPAEESRKKTRQPPPACRLPALRPCHLVAPEYMVTEAAILDVARA